ncbi:hypothetical protein [Kribbella sp. DT2]|uniref:hypothetical protein n=1 Tax=Kribbella sp. DT2 TaxID=3393427 RepID=UPI003CE87831
MANRWNGDLYATEGDTWGGFNPSTGRIALSHHLVLRHLKGSGHVTHPAEQAQALATVLHEATHAQMWTDAPDQPNAVRSEHSLGAMEGFAEVRAMKDFRAFARQCGYPGLDLPRPHYPAAFAAVEDLLKQASGPRKTFAELITEGTRGPGVMHFDQLADGVLRNRLHDVVPDRAGDRLAVRAALIETMMHPAWPGLKNVRDSGIGQAVAANIRAKLDRKVDQIRRHYRATPGRVFPAEGANAEVVRVAEGNKLAALPAPNADDRVERPARGGEMPSQEGTRASYGIGDLGPSGRVEAGGVGDGQASRGLGSCPEVRGAEGGRNERGAEGEKNEREVEGEGKRRGAGGGEDAMRVLGGQAPAAGATGWRPRLGQGARGAGRGGQAGQRVDAPERWQRVSDSGSGAGRTGRVP